MNFISLVGVFIIAGSVLGENPSDLETSRGALEAASTTAAPTTADPITAPPPPTTAAPTIAAPTTAPPPPTTAAPTTAAPAPASTGNLYYVDDGCHSERRTPDDIIGYYEDESSVAAYVRCCSNDGTTCDTVSNCRRRSDLVAYADAENKCIDNGMRLCTKDELLSDICCGTGGNCDSAAVWTSTPNELPDGWEALETSDGTDVYVNSANKEFQWDKPKVETNYMVDDGCQSERRTPDDYEAFYQPESSFAYVRCCSGDGSSCATPESCRNKRYLVSYADAETKCMDLGMRLCTWDELLTDICCGTGGGCDSYLVWTSTAE